MKPQPPLNERRPEGVNIAVDSIESAERVCARDRGRFRYVGIRYDRLGDIRI